ncbi:MAG: segregation/condensation protein A [Nitrospira sp.]|nr:segregation/condensation protein A [Candidatus Manganitrophaceae bacterium]HIL34593.1 segregation/condensation protein A [Candidatus Manganitrophaceae bacterium]
MKVKESLEEFYEVKVGTFEGPLELLLHLIKKNEINLYDIPIALITKQYIEALDLMKALNLSIAGEFLVMAATLIHIKSKMLLPLSDLEEEGEEVDPRQELIWRLLEYKRFKDAASNLENREAEWRDIYRREPVPSLDLPSDDVSLVDVSLYELFDAFQSVLSRTKDESILEISPDTLSVKEQMQFLLERIGSVDSLLFEELALEMMTRRVVIVTFVALLEVIRLGLIRILQGEVCGPLRLMKTKNLVTVQHD